MSTILATPTMAVEHQFPCDPGVRVEGPEPSPPNAPASWPSHDPEVPPTPGAILVREFDALYQKYRQRVYRQCYRMLGNHGDAEDLTQEVFLQLFRKAHTFRGDASFSTWLHRITINTVLMQLRRHRRWRDEVISFDVTPQSNEGAGDVLALVKRHPDPFTNMLDKLGLDSALSQLSPGYKQVFLLHDLEGYRHDEIAELLGISEGTSKSQLHKARLRMQVLMGSPSHQGVATGARRVTSRW